MTAARPTFRPERPPLLELQAVGKSFRTIGGDDVEALADVSLDVREGEFVTVVGPSGCGKTTLLRVLAGLIRPSSGEVRLRGTPVDRPRAEIGIVFQKPVLLPWRTVLENALLPAEVLRLDLGLCRSRALELLRMLRIGDFANRYPMELSGGMQQRAAIGRALAADPAILLMDEPFGALDALTRERMNLDLQRIWLTAGKTIFFITHSIPEAVFLGDRVVVMTPRPGCIAKICDVPMPRPRELAVQGSPEFARLTQDIRSVFETAGAFD